MAEERKNNLILFPSAYKIVEELSRGNSDSKQMASVQNVRGLPHLLRYHGADGNGQVRGNLLASRSCQYLSARSNNVSKAFTGRMGQHSPEYSLGLDKERR